MSMIAGMTLRKGQGSLEVLLLDLVPSSTAALFHGMIRSCRPAVDTIDSRTGPFQRLFGPRAAAFQRPASNPGNCLLCFLPALCNGEMNNEIPKHIF